MGKTSSDPRASAAIEAAGRIMVMWREAGGTNETLRALFAEVSAFADGKTMAPSAQAMALYESIRVKSSSDGESLAEFIRMISVALDMIDVRLVAGGCA